MRMLKKYLTTSTLIAITSILAIGCSTKEDNINPTATIDIENYGTIVAELYPDMAPNTVNNFIELAEKGFYDNLTMHRVITDFVLQGGDPDGIGTGGPGYSIEGEFASNGYAENTLSHTEGVLSMARSAEYNSAGSQFFIMSGDATYLDGEYAGFGKVIEGIDIVNEIETVETDESDKPLEDVVIKSITINNNGYKAGKVNKIK